MVSRLNNPKYISAVQNGDRPEWVGKIYPPKTKEKNFLQHYVEHYNCIELNATHYKIYGAAGISKWAEKAKGKDFLFCPKMYQGVTHRGSFERKRIFNQRISSRCRRLLKKILAPSSYR